MNNTNNKTIIAKEANTASVNNLFGIKIDSSGNDYVSNESIINKVNDMIGIRPVLASYNHNHNIPRFTVELTLAQMEALLALKVGA